MKKEATGEVASLEFQIHKELLEQQRIFTKKFAATLLNVRYCFVFEQLFVKNFLMRRAFLFLGDGKARSDYLFRTPLYAICRRNGKLVYSHRLNRIVNPFFHDSFYL